MQGDDPECIEYPEAAKLMGHSYYIEKNYGEALKYYNVALDCSEYIEYQYEIYYLMAECYHYLKDYVTASKMHRLFLDNNWEPERLPKQVLSSKKYLEDYEKNTKVNY
jgi:tetratricopeptide (TPR) repeat protein